MENTLQGTSINTLKIVFFFFPLIYQCFVQKLLSGEHLEYFLCEIPTVNIPDGSYIYIIRMILLLNTPL